MVLKEKTSKKEVKMGFFSQLFGSTKDGETIKVRQSREDCSKVTADRYTHTEGGGHVHESYNLDTSSGHYVQYGEGENSGERSYNRDK